MKADDLLFRKTNALHVLVLSMGQNERQTGLPEAATSVVKAFTRRPAALLAREPAQDGVVVVAGNDHAANAGVKALAEEPGFAPVVLGRIDGGGRLLHIPGPLVLHDLVDHPPKEEQGSCSVSCRGTMADEANPSELQPRMSIAIRRPFDLPPAGIQPHARASKR